MPATALVVIFDITNGDLHPAVDLKKGPIAERPFLKNGRGGWHSFEPYPQLITPIVTVFDGPALPFVATAKRLVRLCA